MENKNINEYMEYMKHCNNYKTIINLIYWDLQTKTPIKGEENNMDALSYFSTELFNLQTSPKYEELIENVINDPNFEDMDNAYKISFKRQKKTLDEEKRIPKKLYKEFVEAKAKSEKAWERAKENNDFDSYLPHLDKMISMTRDVTGYTNPNENVYDVLLNKFERGVTNEDISMLFNDVKSAVIKIMEHIKEKPTPDFSQLDSRIFDVDKQKKLQDFMLKYIGFNFEAGTTGESAHPFTMSICPSDVRVTNHYSEHNVIDSIFSAIHEGGHAIFDQNINKEYRFLAVGDVDQLGLHESQSRFFENILGRSKEFWLPIYDELPKIIPSFENLSLDTFMNRINHVEASLIRTEADEVSYCLHIILRFEIEKAIFIDGVKTKDLPELWNEKTKELLGIVPPNNKLGILQDMHWSDGSFGYFPSYLLGSIYDGMILENINKNLGDVNKLLENNKILDITHYLNEKIHKYGSLYESKEVMKNLGFDNLSAKPLINYFNNKYMK